MDLSDFKQRIFLRIAFTESLLEETPSSYHIQRSYLSGKLSAYYGVMGLLDLFSHD